MRDLLLAEKRIIEVRQINYLTLSKNEIYEIEREFKLLCDTYLQCILKCNDPKVLHEIIERDWNSFDLTIPLMFETYKRLIVLEPSALDNYRLFSQYLLLYGPDWEEEANVILESLNSNLNMAFNIAQSINYDKG